MARGGNRNVNLLIRAKDETTKVVNTITKALASLAEESDDLQSSADGAGNSLAKIGKALASFNKEFRGQSGPAKLAAELEKAESATKGLEAALSATLDEAKDLAKAQSEAAVETAKLATAAKEAATALKTESTAAAKLVAEEKALKAETRAASDEMSKQNTAMRRNAASIEKTEVRLAAARARTEELATAMASAEKVSARQRTTFASSEKNVERLTGVLREYQLAQTEIAARVAVANAAVESQKAALAGVTGSVASQAAAVAKLAVAEKEAAVVAKEASQAQDKLEVEVRKVAAAIDLQEAALAKGKVELQQFAAAAGKGEVAVQQFAAGVKGTLKAAIDEQNRALDQSGRELRENEAVLAEYRRALAATDAPSKDLIQSFAKTAAGSQVMRQEIALQERALAEMRQELARTGDSYDDVIRAQAAFVGAQARTGAGVSAVRGTSGALESLEQTRIAAAQARAEFAKVDAEARQLGASLTAVGPPTFAQAQSIANLRQFGAEMQITETAVKKMDAALAQAASGALSYEEAVRRVGASSRLMNASLTSTRTIGNQTRTTLTQIGAAASGVGTGARSGANGLSAFWNSLRKINADGRQTLSVMERIRGQALSLAAAYGGVFGAIQALQGVIGVFRAVEAAQSRLNVVYDGNEAAISKDMDFLRRTADRLGLSFVGLSDNYTKFAAATQGTNLAGAETRRIFTVMSEAARVYKLDQEQVNGTFVALTQIASKGKIQLEELSGQLGDRLPGVLKILADGMGLVDNASGTATAQLLDLTKAGKVTSAELSKLADGFASRIEGKLPAALESTTTQIDSFFRNIERAFLQIAEGGFIDAFTRFLRDVNELLQSDEAAGFFGRLSEGLALVTDGLGVLVRNFRLVGTLIATFIGYKLSTVALGIAGAFGKWAAESTAAAAAARAAGVAVAGTSGGVAAAGAAAGTAAVGVRGLGAAFMFLRSATGIGLLVTGATAAFGYWATSAEDATAAVNQHLKVMDKVRNAYDAAGGKVDEWKKRLDGLSESQVRANVEAQKAALAQARAATGGGFSLSGTARSRAASSVGSLFSGTDRAAVAQFKAIEDASDAFEEGSIKGAEYKKVLDTIANSAVTPAMKEYALAEQEVADAAIEQEARVAEAEKALAAMTGTSEESKTALDSLTGAAAETADTMTTKAAVNTAKFEEALKSLKDFIPGLKEELKFDEEVAEIEALRKTLEGLDLTVEQRAQAEGMLGQASAAQAIGGDFSKTADAVVKASNGVEAAAILLRKKEGFIARPSWDVNAQRVGFGSDTVTLSDGSVRKVTKGMSVSVEDANRDLYRRIGEFQNTVKGQIGGGTFGGMNAPQQAALTSIAYNYGSLPKTLVAAIKSGNQDGIVQAIQGLGGDNKGINRVRRNQEAGLFGRGAAPTSEDVEDQIKEQDKAKEKAAREAEKAKEKADREAERAAEKSASFRESQDQKNTELQAELAGEGQLTKEATIQAALAKQQADAKKAGGTVTPEDVALLKEATAAEWDREAAKRGQTAQDKAQAEVQAQVQALETQKGELENQRKIYQEQGDEGKVAETDVALAAVNAKLLEAVNNAKAMWSAIGGPEADAAIAKLTTTTLEVGKQKEDFLSWGQVGEMAASGLTNAFDSFAKSVAEGKDVGEAARDAFLQFASDFLRQIAQMIIKQALLNAMGGLTGGASGGIGSLLGIAHSGAVVGGGNFSGRQRMVSPALFANAQRFHTGGMPGLRPDEVPIIAQKGEEILAKGDARNALNGGGKAANVNVPAAQVKVVNMFDGGSFLSEGLGTVEGEQAMLNFVRSNSTAFKGALG